MLKIFYFLLFLLFLVFSAHAEVYKWVDENGKVHYSDKKTSKSAQQLEVKAAKQIDKGSSKTAEDRLSKQEKYLDYLREERKEKKKKREIKKQEKIEHARYCNGLKDDLENLTQEYVSWYDLDEDTGERHFLSDDELEQRIEETRVEINNNCG